MTYRIFILCIIMCKHIEATMNILCITHADFETPGVIHDWAQQQKHVFKICKPYKNEDCLNQDFDVLIVMGGPQDAGDHIKIKYLHDEVTLIKKAIEQNKIVIGFCLGAQLIGEALDAATTKSPDKEIGVFPIELTHAGMQHPLFIGFNKIFKAIHWHNDMPGLPKNAVILASSRGCPRQIIQFAERVYGFQCHLEITHDGMQELIASCLNDLNASTYTQTKEEMLNADYVTIHQSLFVLLNRLIAS